ncbi:hypothetical protein ACA910_007422 [Epithemia clementina (nom. ined.)]
MGHVKDIYMRYATAGGNGVVTVSTNPSRQWICQVLCHHPTLLFFVENPEAVKTRMPWPDSKHYFSGIPPHVAALHDLMVVRDEQRLLVDQFMDKMKALLDEQGIQYGGALLSQNL